MDTLHDSEAIKSLPYADVFKNYWNKRNVGTRDKDSIRQKATYEAELVQRGDTIRIAGLQDTVKGALGEAITEATRASGSVDEMTQKLIAAKGKVDMHIAAHIDKKAAEKQELGLYEVASNLRKAKQATQGIGAVLTEFVDKMVHNDPAEADFSKHIQAFGWPVIDREWVIDRMKAGNGKTESAHGSTTHTANTRTESARPPQAPGTEVAVYRPDPNGTNASSLQLEAYFSGRKDWGDGGRGGNGGDGGNKDRRDYDRGGDSWNSAYGVMFEYASIVGNGGRVNPQLEQAKNKADETLWKFVNEAIDTEVRSPALDAIMMDSTYGAMARAIEKYKQLARNGRTPGAEPVRDPIVILNQMVEDAKQGYLQSLSVRGLLDQNMEGVVDGYVKGWLIKLSEARTNAQLQLVKTAEMNPVFKDKLRETGFTSGKLQKVSDRLKALNTWLTHDPYSNDFYDAIDEFTELGISYDRNFGKNAGVLDAVGRSGSGAPDMGGRTHKDDKDLVKMGFETELPKDVDGWIEAVRKFIVDKKTVGESTYTTLTWAEMVRLYVSNMPNTPEYKQVGEKLVREAQMVQETYKMADIFRRSANTSDGLKQLPNVLSSNSLAIDYYYLDRFKELAEVKTPDYLHASLDRAYQWKARTVNEKIQKHNHNRRQNAGAQLVELPPQRPSQEKISMSEAIDRSMIAYAFLGEYAELLGEIYAESEKYVGSQEIRKGKLPREQKLWQKRVDTLFDKKRAELEADGKNGKLSRLQQLEQDYAEILGLPFLMKEKSSNSRSVVSWLTGGSGRSQGEATETTEFVQALFRSMPDELRDILSNSKGYKELFQKMEQGKNVRLFELFGKNVFCDDGVNQLDLDYTKWLVGALSGSEYAASVAFDVQRLTLEASQLNTTNAGVAVASDTVTHMTHPELRQAGEGKKFAPSGSRHVSGRFIRTFDSFLRQIEVGDQFGEKASILKRLRAGESFSEMQWRTVTSNASEGWIVINLFRGLSVWEKITDVSLDLKKGLTGPELESFVKATETAWGSRWGKPKEEFVKQQLVEDPKHYDIELRLIHARLDDAKRNYVSEILDSKYGREMADVSRGKITEVDVLLRHRKDDVVKKLIEEVYSKAITTYDTRDVWAKYYLDDNNHLKPERYAELGADSWSPFMSLFLGYVYEHHPIGGKLPPELRSPYGIEPDGADIDRRWSPRNLRYKTSGEVLDVTVQALNPSSLPEYLDNVVERGLVTPHEALLMRELIKAGKTDGWGIIPGQPMAIFNWDLPPAVKQRIHVKPEA